MTILPFELALTVSAAIAVFGLGFVAWWSNKWSRGNVLFALLSFTLALWTSVDWFRDLETTALPLQVIIWRMLFYLSVALAPAIAIHLTTTLTRRPLGAAGWSMYGLGFLHFALLDTAFLLRSVFHQLQLGVELLDVGAFVGLIVNIIALFVIAALMYPTLHDRATSILDRRRAAYALLLLVAYIVAASSQFVTTPVPALVIMTVLSVAFFVMSSAALIRVKFLDIDFAALEALFIVLAAGSIVMILRATTFTEGAIALVGAMLIGLFGARAIRVVRGESRRRKELERINCELEELDIARRDFVASVAHQLRGPLGGIRFAAEMFSRGDYGPMTANAKKVMEHMRTSADHLLSLAETSLNAARVEAGVFQTMISDVDAAAELRDLAGSLDLSARAKGVTITTNFRKLPQRLKLDREAFRNVMFNLLDNAVKYTEKGTIMLDAAIYDRKLLVTVSDTGAGLSREDLSRLFKKFSRGEEGKRIAKDGAGLGLYVCKKLVDEMGGTISAGSAGLGKGSVFRVELPLRS
ncbi:MAG: HAMP domain-containing sensor histidine kinase [Patescibacteria group bacterium]|jgi:signal transduction histidine kinase